jgi:hypothetical protein
MDSRESLSAWRKGKSAEAGVEQASRLLIDASRVDP